MRDSGVGDIVPLRFAGVFVLFLGLLVLDDVFADVPIVVVTYVIAVVDTVVAKFMESRVLCRLSSARSSLGGGGFEWTRLFFVAIMARSLDWRAGWRASVGDSRSGSRSISFGC